MKYGPIRILIVDDHAIVREGLRAMIEGKTGLALAGEAANGDEAVLRARETQPDVILMDLVMPKKTGIEAICEIVAENPSARILVLTSFADDEQVFAAIRGGAMGYLLKDSLPGELIEAIRSVHRGEPSLHPAVARKLLISPNMLQDQAPVDQAAPGDQAAQTLGGNGAAPASAAKNSPTSSDKLAQERSSSKSVPQVVLDGTLTEREVDVLRLMAKGMSNTDIAKALVLGEGTVRFHVSNILNKLDLENRTQAVLYALRTGLAKLE